MTRPPDPDAFRCARRSRHTLERLQAAWVTRGTLRTATQPGTIGGTLADILCLLGGPMDEQVAEAVADMARHLLDEHGGEP